MAGKKSRKNPLKVLEKIGKECLTGGLDTLIQNNVLKLEEEEKKKLNDAKPGDKPWVVVDAVRQKRHQVGQVLLQTVFNVDTKRHQVGQVLLQTVFNVDTKTNDTEAHPETDPKESPDALKLCTHEEFQRLCKEKAGEIYPIREKNDRTRLALIICNTEFEHFPWRSGAEHDIRGMTKLLEALDYTVVEEENLTASEMESVLRAFAGRSEHKTSDSTFLVFMSHGILEGICGTVHSDKNPDVLPYDTIFQILNNLNCISLKDKPKVIIVQACRGGRSGEVWARDSPESLPDSSSQSPTTLVEDGVYKTHVEKDFIAFFSSTPHNKSWRNKEKGSPFITELIGCFQKYSCRCHLEELFLKVRSSFDKPNTVVQMPTVERSSTTKYFYLFPGN